MLVRTITGVDHTCLDSLREKLRCTGRAVPKDNDVGMICLEHAGGVLQRLAFRQARGRRGDIDDVSAQPLGRKLERGSSAGARLDKKINQGPALQGRNLLDFSRPNLLE